MASDKSPLAGVDANLLVILDALLVERNVGRAARRVGLSASATSHALARIRDVLGDPILVRAGDRMVVTPRAAGLAPALHEGLSLLARALTRPPAFDPAMARGSIRIAAVDFAQHILRRFVPVLRREAPWVDVTVLPFVTSTFAELSDGDVDLGLAAISANAQRPTKQLAQSVLSSERFVCVARRSHPALRGRLTAKRFAALDHVMVSPRGRTPGATDVALRRFGLRRRIVLVVPTFLAAAMAVADSDLVLTCAERSAFQVRGWLDLEVFPPPVKVASATLSMLWHRRTEDDPLLAFVRDRLTQLARAT